MDLSEYIVFRIKRYRKEHRLTQAEVAKITGYTRSAIANIESGKQDILVSQLVKFSEAFGVTIYDLLPVQNKSEETESFVDKIDVILKVKEKLRETLKEQQETLTLLASELDEISRGD